MDGGQKCKQVERQNGVDDCEEKIVKGDKSVSGELRRGQEDARRLMCITTGPKVVRAL